MSTHVCMCECVSVIAIVWPAHMSAFFGVDRQIFVVKFIERKILCKFFCAQTEYSPTSKREKGRHVEKDSVVVYVCAKININIYYLARSDFWKAGFASSTHSIECFLYVNELGVSVRACLSVCVCACVCVP